MAKSGITTVRWKRLAVALVLTGAAVAVPATNAFAGSAFGEPVADNASVTLLSGDVVPLDPSARTAEQESAFRDQISLLDARGELTPAMMAEMGLRELTPSSNPAPVAEDPPAQPDTASPATTTSSGEALACSISNSQTSASAMSVPAPKITLSGSSQNYILYATATYKWSSPPLAPSTCVVPVGGVDGFAVALNRASTNLGVSFSACNSYGKCGSYGYLETNSQYGGGWAFQDYATSALLGSGATYRGTLTYGFRLSRLSGCTQAFSKYAHDWSSTSVNGFSIGPWSIGVQWSSSSANWTRSSQAGSYGSC